MDINKILLEQRNLNLKNHGFYIYCEPSDISAFRYTVKNFNFAVYVYRDDNNEIDTLSQIITYLDSTPHKIALAESRAYDDSLNTIRSVMKDQNIHEINSYLQDKLKNAKKVDLKKELEEIGIENINSLHCTDVLALEESKTNLAELYMNLASLKQSAEQQGLNYDLAILAAEKGLQKI